MAVRSKGFFCLPAAASLDQNRDDYYFDTHHPKDPLKHVFTDFRF